MSYRDRLQRMSQGQLVEEASRLVRNYDRACWGLIILAVTACAAVLIATLA